MRDSQQYIADNQHLVSFGDQLTFERYHHVQEDMSLEEGVRERLINIIPAISDLHGYGNFLEVLLVLCFILFVNKYSSV